MSIGGHMDVCSICAAGGACESEYRQVVMDLGNYREAFGLQKALADELRAKLAEAERRAGEAESALIFVGPGMKELQKRATDAEKCAEVLCTFALTLPSECGPDVDHCESEHCGECRAIDACAPYMARNKREAQP